MLNSRNIQRPSQLQSNRKKSVASLDVSGARTSRRSAPSQPATTPSSYQTDAAKSAEETQKVSTQVIFN